MHRLRLALRCKRLQKGKRWVKQKYFHPYRNQNWAFTGEGTSRDGKKKLLHLLYAKATPIEMRVTIMIVRVANKVR
jgi:hypothetical protein